MYKVGLTGNLYSGIEDVCLTFKEKGIPVFDADVILKFVLNWEQETLRDVRIQFSADVFQSGFIKSSSFNTDQKTNRLIDVARDKVMNKYREFIKKNGNSKFVIFKSHFLYESNFVKEMDYNISIHKPKEERIKALKKDTNVFGYLAQEYLEPEMPELSKNKTSNFIINNSDLSNSLDKQIDYIITEIDSKIKKP
jgi:dephospho-CoA kinase